MIKIENMEVWGFQHAIRGMRNPLNSWDRSDSQFNDSDTDMKIGENDLGLMRRLYKGGQPHRKYLRQIFVSMDITAPLYWWKEFDTYKVGTTANSCSTMHKIHDKPFVLEDFSFEHLFDWTEEVEDNSTHYDAVEWLKTTINQLNHARLLFVNTKNKDYWWLMIQLLPTSYNQKRTVTMTYENIMNMLEYREGHKLDEWREFCTILKSLPYVEEIREQKD